LKNIHKHSEEMQADAGEFVVVLNGVATDMATEEGLARGAETAFGLAPEIEEATTPGAPNAAYAESQTVEFWNWVPAADRKQAEAAADAVNNEEAIGLSNGGPFTGRSRPAEIATAPRRPSASTYREWTAEKYRRFDREEPMPPNWMAAAWI
jgi:hypothetical protein